MMNIIGMISTKITQSHGELFLNFGKVLTVFHLCPKLFPLLIPSVSVGCGHAAKCYKIPQCT